jgi:hypothetical protein
MTKSSLIVASHLLRRFLNDANVDHCYAGANRLDRALDRPAGAPGAGSHVLGLTLVSRSRTLALHRRRYSTSLCISTRMNLRRECLKRVDVVKKGNEWWRRAATRRWPAHP